MRLHERRRHPSSYQSVWPDPVQDPSPVLALTEREVHLWYVFADRLTDPAMLTACEQLLSAEERARRDRFVFARGRHEFLVTRALVRTTLSRYAAVRPEAWDFTSNAHGRPEIAAPADVPPLRFNLTHSGGLVACAVAMDRAIGVDVETTDRRSIGLDLAQRYFAPQETAQLQALPPELQPEAFFDYWTLKEAYIKARGMGLSLPLAEFSFQLRPGQPITIAFSPALEDDPTRWQFAQLRVGSRYKLAVAIERAAGPDLELIVRETMPMLGD